MIRVAIHGGVRGAGPEHPLGLASDDEMISEWYRSVCRVRGPNIGLHLLALLSSGLDRVKSSVDALAIRTRRNRNCGILAAMHAAVLETPPVQCNPAARTAIHTVTAHHHLNMYLTAIKSLLRYHDDIAVVVHDDGSLDARDESLLRHHLAGVRYIDRASADRQMSPILAGYSHCRQLRERVVNSLELFDNMLLEATERIINMNSDVLFLREPAELISWTVGGDSSIVGVYEADPAGQKEFLERRGSQFPPHVTTALTCFYEDTCKLDLVESVLAETTPDWFTAQNVYPLLYEHQAAQHDARFFDQNGYQASGVFGDDAVFRHYWTSTGMFTDIQHRDSARAIGELAARTA